MKTLFLALYTALAFMACNPLAPSNEGQEIRVTIKEEVAWYSDFTLEDLMGDGETYFAGRDTLLHVTDPVITYYSDRPIKSASVKIEHNGKWYLVPSRFDVGGNRLSVYNDEIYGALGDSLIVSLKDRVRFEIEAQ